MQFCLEQSVLENFFPEKFQVEINTFIKSLKNENQTAKKDGKVTE